jgi:hypothetical protein
MFVVGVWLGGFVAFSCVVGCYIFCSLKVLKLGLRNVWDVGKRL